ncbi:MAG: GntR family transcriptional regulator [Lentisphaeria bacterium]|uniref:GntR family transcriptional regulator n=1 Tax=Victivallis lenta TaxID=2606640 RepID=UPI0015AA1C76|nr:GntR family transcriptional regulator [Victivallis lenta]MBS1453693.1 GntR family transcriptional regulator [Lentisphaeria bacterium]
MTEQPPGRKEKAAPVIRDLASKIACGTYGPGRKIPSLRKLSERYGVSVSTARRSVKALADKGMLTFLHGSGTFVAEKRSPADRRFRIAAVAATFGVNAMNTCTGIAVNGILDAADELGIELTTIPMRFEEMSDARLEALSGGFDGVILLGGYDGILSSPRPVCAAVGLSMHDSCGGLFSLIELDPFRATELAVGFFRERGVREVAVAGHARPAHRLREQLFRDAWQSVGTLLFPPDDTPGEYRPGRGIYFTCGAAALAAAEAYHAETGRELGRDYPVLCFDGHPLFVDRPHRNLPTLAINLRLAGVAAAEECLRRITCPGSASRRIYIAPELYPGE